MNSYQHGKALTITIHIPGVSQPLSNESLERSVAKSVLDWIQSDDSGLAGPLDTLVKVEITDDHIPPGRWWEKDYHETGEQILLAHDNRPVDEGDLRERMFRACLDGGRK